MSMSEDKEKIMAVYKLMGDAMVNKDIKTLDNLFNDDYTVVHMSGYEQSKQDFLKQIENEKMRYFESMPQKTAITIDGDKAILISDTKINARIYGLRNTWSLRMEMDFEKRGDNWYPINSLKTESN